MASSQLPQGRGRGRGRPGTRGAGSLSKVANVNIASTADDVQTLVAPLTNTTINEVPANPQAVKPLEQGTIGEQITVVSNCFPVIQWPQNGRVYKYDIEIRNKVDRLILHGHRRAVYYTWLKNFCEKHGEINPHRIVFDGQKLIFTFDQPLPTIDQTGTREKITGPNRYHRQEEYDVFIQQVGNPIDLRLLSRIEECSQTQNDDNILANELESLKQMLSIVLHEYCSSQADFIFNRSFFSRSIAADRYGSWDLGLGKAAWRGFYSCLVFAKGVHQLLMNLDVSYRVFTKEQPFLGFLREVMLRSPCGQGRYDRFANIGRVELKDVLEFLDPNANGNYYQGEVEFLLSHCKSLLVRAQVANNTTVYRIIGLGEAAATQKFYWDKKKMDVTVEKYNKEQYGLELQYPILPTLKMHNGSFLPMEFVQVIPVKVTRITDEQRAMLCLKSSLRPPEYFQSITEVREKPNQQRFEEDPFIAAWNFGVEINMLTIPARILPVPQIICNERNIVTHRRGDKRGVWNQTKTPFYKPTAFPTVWALINLTLSMNRLACEKFYEELRKVAVDRRIDCPAPVIYEKYDIETRSNKQIVDALREIMEKNNDCQFFIVILPENKTVGDRIYGDIKQLCELQSGLGIVTQMIKLKENESRGRWNYSRLNNILMKINTKLDGINSILHIHDNIKQFFSRGKRTMYVGVDLSHGPSGSSRHHSTVAVVASVDDIPIRYLKEIYVQHRPADLRGESWEHVVDMKKIMKSLILQYKEHQDHPPNAIFIYRDGISTSEFRTVFQSELTAVREACIELSTAYQPYLTYIVVNKRHHTRFFPTDSYGNIEAGTIVDSPDITDLTTYDFYLNSHHVDEKKGTSRPTHYRVLYDDNKLKPDQVQLLTYTLCYLHARCTSSISIPAPVKYADILAFRASVYRNTDNVASTEPQTTASTSPTNEKSKITSEWIVLSSKLKSDCMFFL